MAEAIRELLKFSPNEKFAAAKIALAKAAGIISSDVVLAEEMLEEVKTSKKLAANAVAKKSRQGGKLFLKKQKQSMTVLRVIRKLHGTRSIVLIS